MIILIYLITSLVYVPANVEVQAAEDGAGEVTYDFGGTVGENDSAGPGFATFSEMFVISNGFKVDPGTTQLYSTNYADSAEETLIIKKTGGKTFTFKDLGISLYHDSPRLTLTNLSLVLKDPNGKRINDEIYSLTDYELDNEEKVTQLSSLFNDGAQFNHANVASIEITWKFYSIYPPSNLNFENITIANVNTTADDIPPVVSDGTINTTNINPTDVTLDWTKAEDNITPQGDLEYRIYQSNSNNIDTVNNIEENGKPLGSGFSKDLAIFNVTDLSPTTSYYFNVIVRDAAGNKSAYMMKQVTTSSQTTTPTVTTDKVVSNLTQTSATVGGDVTSDGGASIKERGIVYAVSENPTTSDSKETASGTTGNFTTELTELIPNTTYHFRAYATNSEGTSYGGNQTFTTNGLNNNANLSNLKLSTGILNPVFSPGTTEYTTNVANSVTSISMIPTVADSTAFITVNGVPVSSGEVSADIPLTVGENDISIVVTAQNNSKKTYRITVTRALSSNADLSNLTLSSGTLSPGFSSGTTEYTASVANSITSINVTPTAADNTATVTVKGVLVESGQASTEIHLTVGDNEIPVTVTAQSGDTKTYIIKITRARGSKINLSNITLSSGTLSPKFSSDTTEYTAIVANSVTSVKVTPTVADSTASVTVNGLPISSGEASGDIQLNIGSNEITIVVTAQSGDTKTYNITITREANVNANLSNLTLSSGTLSPEFSSDTTEYTAIVVNSVTSVKMTPTAADSTATIKVNDITVKSGEASADIPLTVGENDIFIVITAQDNSTKTYLISITRVAPMTYTVTYDGNGATNGTVPIDNQRYGEYTDVTVLDNTGQLVKTNHKFTGWNTKADGTGTSYSPNDTFTMGNGNIILYAKWTKNGQSSSKPGGSSSSGTKRKAYIGIGTSNSNYTQVDIIRTIKSNKKIDQVVFDNTILNKTLMGALEQKQDLITILIHTLPSDPADEVLVTLPEQSTGQLSTSNFKLRIETEDVSIHLPKESIQSISGKKKDLFFRIIPIREETEQQDIFENALKAKVVKEIAGDKEVKVLSRPMTIETNYQDLNAILTFPLKEIPLPSNQFEREKFLKSLAVFIEHSDGEKVVQRGNIKYGALGEPVGLEIESSKFSTFTIIGLPESDFDGIEMEAPQKVMQDKVWTITFNTSINPSTITNSSIYVQDMNGNKVNVNVKLVNSKTIQVIPIEYYESNQTYYLYVTNQIHSMSGNPLSESFRMSFTIDN
ncbi:cadherin-like beta sandwich domain-containing protein [Lysinibacillus telephonicus]|uniref:cadherin-like beta sandwich domain-containing protein n=1 Tax=Lysinibacillus telephonicus TaxID=1714840 RepID=UPI003B9E7DE6